MKNNNSPDLTDEILDLRRSAKGKGTMYIIIPDGQERRSFLIKMSLTVLSSFS